MIFELRTLPKKSNMTPLTMDLVTMTPLKFITKEEIAARIKVFTKTDKEKADLATAKARHKQPSKRKLNTETVQNKILKAISNSKKRFKLNCNLIVT